MNIKLILFSAFLAVVGFGAVFYWEIKKQAPNPPPSVDSSALSGSITPFEHQMLAKGYSRDHVTHRWYPAWESYTNNGCAVYGSPLDATFICRTPLTDGIPDEK